MKTSIKRLITGVISAAMVLSSASVFAEAVPQDVQDAEEIEVSEQINENTEISTKDAGFVDYSVFGDKVAMNESYGLPTGYHRFRPVTNSAVFHTSGDTLYIANGDILYPLTGSSSPAGWWNYIKKQPTITKVAIEDTAYGWIPHEFFKGFNYFETVDIYGKVSRISDRAFFSLNNLKEVNFHNESLGRIERSAFTNCTSYKKINISKNTTSIYKYTKSSHYPEYDAFYGCSTDIYIDNYKGAIPYEPWGTTGHVYWRDELRIDDIPDQYYYGEPVEPDVTVKLVDTTDDSYITLTKDTDYAVTYENNNAVGTGTAKIRFIGDYVNAPDMEKTFNIVSPVIEIEPIPDQTYYAVALTPEIDVYDNTTTNTKLVNGTDYTVSYSDNNAVGTGQVTVTMLGKYAKMSNLSATFNIVNPDLKIEPIPDQMAVPDNEGIYAVEPVTPKVYIYDYTSDKYLSEGVDFNVEYVDSDIFGEVLVNIQYINHYRGYTGDQTSTTFILKRFSLDEYEDGSINMSGSSDIKVYANDVVFDPAVGPIDSIERTSTDKYSVVWTPTINGVQTSVNLVEGRDFYVENNGNENVAVAGMGKFYGLANGSFTVYPYDLSLLDVNDNDTLRNLYINDKCLWLYLGGLSEQYNFGNPVCPFNETITDFSFDGEDTYLEAEDYATTDFRMKAHYENNINVGTATVVIEGLAPCFTGEFRYDFQIVPRSIRGNFCDGPYSRVTGYRASIDELTYIGNPITPKFTTYWDDESPDLVEGTDYYIEYENNTAPGTATAILKGIGNYTGELRTEFTIRDIDEGYIEDINLRDVDVVVSDEYTYNGEEKQPKPVVNYTYVVPSTGYKKDFVLEEGEDYTLRYENNVNAGTASIFLEPVEGRSKNGKDKEFDIYAANLSDVTAQDISDQFYTGDEVEPELSLSFNGMNLVKDTDYEVVFENNDAVGTATATICGIGNYSGEISKDFNIVAAQLSDGIVTIADIPDEEYNRKAHTPEPEVKIGDKVLVKDVDFEYSYDNNVKAGTANITVTGKGNYEGSVPATFKIKPRNGSLFVYYLIFFDEQEDD